MENLVFSLNATVPVFLMMLLGLLFRNIGWIDEAFASKMNKFVFLVALPVKVFQDLATVDFEEVWDTKFVLFCFGNLPVFWENIPKREFVIIVLFPTCKIYAYNGGNPMLSNTETGKPSERAGHKATGLRL